MIALSDGRSELYQWDTGRQVSFKGSCQQFHFSNNVYGRTVDVDAVNSDGTSTAKIPDFLLQSAAPLTVYAFAGSDLDGYTKVEKVFQVKRRNKPADYVFTPSEQHTIQDAKDYAEAAQQSAQTATETLDKIKPLAESAQANATAAAQSAGQSQASAETAAQSEKQAAGHVAEAETEADRAAQEADRAKSEADKAAQSLGNSVLVIPQELAPEQKSQALTNIGAQKYEGEFELIQTITLKSDMAINITKEPDGTPYKFKAVKVTVNQQSGGLKFALSVMGKTPVTSSESLGAVSSEGSTQCCITVYPYYGIFRCETGRSNSIGYYGTIQYSQMLKNIDAKTSYINRISTFSEKIKGGSVITIMAVRW